MFEVIPPSDYKKLLWKNGKGTTQELAISAGHSVEDFDWRLSIAGVNENGYFSDFAGYQRALVILAGHGIFLTHANKTTQLLKSSMDYACFGGGWRSYGELLDGPIVDFNVMTKTGRYHAQVDTFQHHQPVGVPDTDFCFAFSLSNPLNFFLNENSESIQVPAGHLIKISGECNGMISGAQWLLICINRCMSS